MTDVVALHRDPVPPGCDFVAELPAWILPHGRYWHQPRSAFVRVDGRYRVRMWCGQNRTCRPDQFASTAPADLICGTCVGRRLGYERTDGVIFQPRDDWRLPTWCPGGDNDGFCLSCGHKLRYGGRYWSAPCRHHPEPGLLKRWRACPYHGWREMHPQGGLLVCATWKCGYTGIANPAALGYLNSSFASASSVVR